MHQCLQLDNYVRKCPMKENTQQFFDLAFVNLLFGVIKFVRKRGKKSSRDSNSSVNFFDFIAISPFKIKDIFKGMRQ